MLNYINQADIWGKTLLYRASEKGDIDEANALLEVNGIDVNQAEKGGYTPLNIAACNGHLDVVKSLLEVNGIDVNQANQWGYTPLHSATINGHLDVVKALLEVNGIDVNKAEKGGYTPLHIAACNGRLDVVKALLEVNGIDVNQANQWGDTPLHSAAMSGRLEVVKALLANGVEDKPNKDGKTALYFAVKNRNLEMLKAILAMKGAVSDETLSRVCQEDKNKQPKSVLMLIEERIYEKGNLAEENDKEIYDLIMKEASGHIKIIDQSTLSSSSTPATNDNERPSKEGFQTNIDPQKEKVDAIYHKVTNNENGFFAAHSEKNSDENIDVNDEKGKEPAIFS